MDVRSGLRSMIPFSFYAAFRKSGGGLGRKSMMGWDRDVMIDVDIIIKINEIDAYLVVWVGWRCERIVRWTRLP